MKTGRENPVPTGTVFHKNRPYTVSAKKQEQEKKQEKIGRNRNGNRRGLFPTVFAVTVLYTGIPVSCSRFRPAKQFSPLPTAQAPPTLPRFHQGPAQNPPNRKPYSRSTHPPGHPCPNPSSSRHWPSRSTRPPGARLPAPPSSQPPRSQRRRRILPVPASHSQAEAGKQLPASQASTGDEPMTDEAATGRRTSGPPTPTSAPQRQAASRQRHARRTVVRWTGLCRAPGSPCLNESARYCSDR